MLRSRALLVFGWTVTLVAIATAPVRSSAAGAARSTRAEIAPVVDMADVPDMKLLPLLARHDAPLLGSFVRSERASLCDADGQRVSARHGRSRGRVLPPTSSRSA